MGNKNSDLTDAQFRQQWQTLTQLDGRNVWQNKQNPTLKLQQYIVREDQVENNPKMIELRKKSVFVVNAHTLKKQGFSCQMDHNSHRLFVQHTVLRLSALKDIPYLDILHLYDVVLHGYGELTQVAGYFSVDQEQIGINSFGQAKVWLSNRFESNRISGVRVTETKMINDLLNLLQSKTNSASRGKYPNIAQYIQPNQKITFQQATSKFVQYMRTYFEGEVQTRLTYLNLNSIIPPRDVVNSVENRNSQTFVNVPQFPNRQVTQLRQQELVKNINFDKVQKISQPVPITITSSQQYVPVSNTSSSIPTNVGASVAPIRISQPYPINFIGVPAQQIKQQIVTRSLKSQTIASGSSIHTPLITFGGRPTTSIKLARTSSQNIVPQGLNLISNGLRSRLEGENVVYVPQPVPTSVRPLPAQNIIPPTQIVELSRAPTLISQSSIPTYNQPIQVVQSFNVNQSRPIPLETSNTSKILQKIQGPPIIENKGEFVTTSIPSGSANLATFSKVAQSEVRNVKTVKNQITTLKGSQTIDWQDYTNKNDTTKGLSSFGRAVPQSFDVGISKKIEPQYLSGATKFTPQSDGKSSPEFLALLSQIKSGIGQSSSISETYSYSGSKNEGTPVNYQTSKYSTKYVQNNYTSSLDPELHADLQRYRQ